MNVKQKNQIKLIALFILFISPMIAAQLYYIYGNHSNITTTNKGVLITPPYSLDNPKLNIDLKKILVYNHADGINPIRSNNFNSEKWHILISKDNTDILYKLGQVHVALGKLKNRVQIAIIPGSKQQFTNNNTNNYLNISNIYISDPHGNIILYYKLDDVKFDSKLLKDLKKLLNISKIG